MGLARLVEQALALERTSGNPLVVTFQSQTFYPYIAASSTVRQELTLPLDSFAAIAYQLSLGDYYPNAFTLQIQNSGVPVFNFVVPAGALPTTPLDLWVLARTRSPLRLTITNGDNVPHSWSSTIHYLLIESPSDAEEIADRLGNSAKGTLERQAVESLKDSISSFNPLSIFGGRR